MSTTGEMTLSTYEETAFAELAADIDRIFVEDNALAAGGLTSVMARAHASAMDLINQRAAGITDVNAGLAAFQSEV